MTMPDATAPGAVCPRCRQPAPAGSRFCAACGSALGPSAGAGPGPMTKMIPWILGGAMVVVLVALVVRPGASGAAAAPADGPAPPASGTPPDLTNMSPRERFDRLYSRVITAAQSGDQATVEQFTPMAIAAFGMLDSATADARYHLAMLQLHIGDLAGAQAQGDSIKLGDPDHLFGYVIGGAVARWKKNDAAKDAAYREFLKRYDAQMALPRPEYVEHKAMLEELKKTTTGGGKPTG